MSTSSATQDPCSAGSRRQKRMGPAPFASFEDLSDELESPEDKGTTGSVVRLPGIREDVSPTPSSSMATEKSVSSAYTGISLVGAAVSPPSASAMSSLSTPQSTTRTSLQTPSTPRIDISRASSSSHHDSRDSTPDRELFEGHDPASAKLGLGFREDGTLDLRSSTEELDFHDQTEKSKKGKTRPQSPSLHDESYQNHQRKDSQSSEIGLLSISGRTSRISSIGSQGSAQSRLSNASHLSVLSGQSGVSRSPSPHKMLLETSFCGTKPPSNSRSTIEEQSGTKTESVEVLEKVLLSRKHDPTEAILAEGVSMMPRRESGSVKLPPEKPARSGQRRVQSVKSDITIRVDKPPPSTDSNNTPKLPRKIVAESGVEYIYIPLRGPLPKDDEETPRSSRSSISLSTTSKLKVRETKSAPERKLPSKGKQPVGKARPKSEKPSEFERIQPSTSTHRHKETEPKYIRIKLKPDYMYSQEDARAPEKPESLDLTDSIKKQKTQPEVSTHDDIRSEPVSTSTTTTTDQGKSLSSTPSASPKLSRHNIIKGSVGSKTPSPSLSRKSSFASLFRSKEAIISPESPTLPMSKRKSTFTGALRDVGDSIRDRSRSRSKSRERDRASNLSAAPSSTESIDSKTKQKSVFSLFKTKKGDKSKSDVDSSSPELLSNLEVLGKVEFKFHETSCKYRETPLQSESIRIPLHSPTHYDSDRSILQELKTSSQDSQETVIEAITRNVDVIVEAIPQSVESNTVVQSSRGDFANRQSSTSSDNIVFSTRLTDNEIFTTKLPKNLKKLMRKPSEWDGSEPAQTNGVHESIPEAAANIPTTPKQESEERTLTKVAESPKNIETELNLEPPEPEVPKTKSNDMSKFDTELSTTSAAAIPSNRSSMMSSIPDEERNSSESERDSEQDFPRNRKELDLKLELECVEPERKGLVLQQDSFEDELPYVPTTLPYERSSAVPIIPIKQRSTFEMKTCPIERPRSTTPINPSCLEEYCEEVMGNFNSDAITKQIEKLKICLPRNDSVETKVKSPRKSGTTTNWSEFAEKGISTGRRSSLTQEVETPPPLPPKGVQKEWINFEEIPEKRKPPKRIQTIPSRGHIDVPDSLLQENVVYNYVNPEECKCECHELSARERKKETEVAGENILVQEDELPLLDDDDEKSGTEPLDKAKLDITVSDRRSIVSDSSVDLSMSVEQVVQSEVNGVDSLRTPFTSDLGLSSNRSSIVSQDEPQSPDSESPNAFPKTS